MQIAFHIGANCTNGDRLLKSILRNADALAKERIAVPGPSRYRKLIRETIQTLDGAKPAENAGDVLLDTIIENDDANRIILSNDNFMAVPNGIFNNAVFYPQAGPKIRALQRIFPDADLSLYMAIRNPVTFLQEALERSDAKSLPEYLGIMQPREIRWSDVVKRIKEAAPDIPIGIWCDEDSPLLWDQLIRGITRASDQTPLVGGFDMLSHVISREGIKLLQQNLKTSPPQTHPARHDMIAEVWETHALPDRIEDEITLPELDPSLVEQMTESYDADVERISQMKGVEVLLPFR